MTAPPTDTPEQTAPARGRRAPGRRRARPGRPTTARRLVAGRPGVLEGLRGEIVRGGPLGRADVEAGPVGRPPVELAVEPRAQQRRHRDAAVPGVDGDERGLALEPLEGREGVVTPGELGGERRGGGRHDAEVLEERPVLLGEPPQDLVAQVGRGRALAPRERGEQAGHLDRPSGRGRDEAEPGGPPAGQGVRTLHLARRHPGPAPRQERDRLGDGEAQPVAGQVGDATDQTQAGQGDRRRGPPGQDETEPVRPVADHRVQLVEHRGVGELSDVVEDEPDLVRERVEHGEQMSDAQRVVGAVRCGIEEGAGERRHACGDGVGHRGGEAPRAVVGRVEGHPRRREGRRPGPVGEEQRLAGAGVGAQRGHRRRHDRRLHPGAQVVPGDEPGRQGGRDDLRRRDTPTGDGDHADPPRPIRECSPGVEETSVSVRSAG